ncbi:MAG: hypothetical protein NTZ17_01880 [Phycisphaerae bacterium]|nr:hypothetical protein [Phycisphaerae bacterium]
MAKAKNVPAEKRQVDFPVAVWLWERWNRKRKEAGLYLHQDLEVLLVVSELMPAEAHKALAAVAESEFARQQWAPLLQKTQQAMYAVFNQTPSPESYPFASKGKKDVSTGKRKVNFPVAAWLWERWNRKCKEADLFGYQDLEALFILSELLPLEAHRTLATVAQSEFARQQWAPVLRKMQQAMYAAFGEALPRESYPFESKGK